MSNEITGTYITHWDKQQNIFNKNLEFKKFRDKFLVKTKNDLNYQRRFFNKIANFGPFTARDLAKLFDHKAPSVKQWERQGILPPARRAETTKKIEFAKQRIYNLEEFCHAIKCLLDYPWERMRFNRDEVEKIYKYLKAFLDANQFIIEKQNNHEEIQKPTGFFAMKPEN